MISTPSSFITVPKIGEQFDCRDAYGDWYLAVVKHYKSPTEPCMPSDAINAEHLLDKIEDWRKLEAIFIHYSAWSEKWDEWIFITPNKTICHCIRQCKKEKGIHRIARANTQSIYTRRRKSGSTKKPKVTATKIIAPSEFQKAPKVKDQFDCRDRWGNWYLAEINHYKASDEMVPSIYYSALNETQQQKYQELIKLEGIFVHYIAWDKKWDEWIFITPNQTICDCKGKCVMDKGQHRIASANTQSEYTKDEKLHKKLSNEAEKRKSEWDMSMQFGFETDALRSNNNCPYYQACTDVMKKYIDNCDSKIKSAMFDQKGFVSVSILFISDHV